jgi:hypothetical protein
VIKTPLIDPQINAGFVSKTIDVGDCPLFEIRIKLSITICCWNVATQMEMESAPTLTFPDIEKSP